MYKKPPYNDNETYELLQDKTPALKSDKHEHEDLKQSKHHVTLLLCTNQKGENTSRFHYKSRYTNKYFYGRLFVPMQL